MHLNDAYIKFYELIVNLYDHYPYLEQSQKLSENQKYLYQSHFEKEGG